MSILKNKAAALLSPLKHQPWPLSTAIARRLDVNKPVEEENTPYYNNPSKFYPAREGDVLNDRYQIAAKLGYGSSSTVWLVRDLNRWRWLDEKYVALKINTNDPQESAAAQKELDFFKHINETNPRHRGWKFIRHLLDSFVVEHQSSGSHLGLAFEPLREPLWIYQKRFVDGVIPSRLLKVLLRMILHGLDYLHSECHIIHTDLKTDNIMVKVEDPSMLEESARDEHENPLPQKVYPDGHTIYLSRNNFGSFRRTAGIIKITDFDLSVRGDGDAPNSGCIQTEIYRAPESIVDAGYSYSTDIWSLGVMLWDVLEGKKLFRDFDGAHGNDGDGLNILGHITALLGPPPKDLLEKGKRTQTFYNLDGTFKGPTIAPTTFNFDNLISTIQGEDKRMFINFVKRMIKWRPEERSTAKELLQDPWLYAGFDK